jgi:hypothetical protein
MLGARVRIAELEQELAELRRLVGDGQTRTGAADAPVRKRKRRAMSAAQRKAVSERMRKYWAGRRKTAK